ncbi:hypothetical protein TD95_003682 [Thielaviopsis punctulata]|uniref:GIY-YIG domain-containing protein n=1 Tax=Thielaviopsis punctulata TaxID=72032 RepID=A0A0F4Z7R5_9PEZI|nr:hypothetical protein TD95_003682 [Thielaviopsis punctulata]
MPIQTKPIPPNYCIYVLRSTLKPLAQPYIGSTPNIPRRLNQHNGLIKGGASRTSRRGYRPWEPVVVVSGFPSSIGALKFEWALNNPHISLHIPKDDRISISTARKRSGMPKRPRATINSILANLHLLLRVPSFARWPLTLHIFCEDVHGAWKKSCAAAPAALPRSVQVKTDFTVVPLRAAVADSEAESQEEDEEVEEGEGEEEEEALDAAVQKNAEKKKKQGVMALPVDYTPLAAHTIKARGIFDSGAPGACVMCAGDLPAGMGFYVVCATDGCTAVGHLDCWAERGLRREKAGAAVLPVEVTCPRCRETARWGDLMREVSLRVRGEKEVDKLVKAEERRKKGVNKE